jgi:hypothetical protein
MNAALCLRLRGRSRPSPLKFFKGPPLGSFSSFFVLIFHKPRMARIERPSLLIAG